MVDWGKVLLLHNNAKQHSERMTSNKIKELGYEVPLLFS